MKKTVYLLTLVTITSMLIASSLVATASSLNSEWHITVNGEFRTPIDFTIIDLANMPRTSVEAAIFCYGVPVTSGNWTGVELGVFLGQVGVANLDGSIDFKASDGYEIKDFPMSAAKRSDVLIAYELNGTALKEELRLVVPGANGNVWISLITQITLKATPGVSLEALTPPLMPKVPTPNFITESPTTDSQPSQPTVQPPQNSTNTPTTQPQQQEQNQNVPEIAEPQPSNQQEQQEPVSSLQPTEYGFALIALIVAVVVATGLVVAKRMKTKKNQSLTVPE